MAAANGRAAPQQQQQQSATLPAPPVQPVRLRRAHIQQAGSQSSLQTSASASNSSGQHQSSHLLHSTHNTSNKHNGPHQTSFRASHQRRQSVARLLPDISKLRLLAWLIEASNELVNCDIAIMEGVYASKLNRSRESLLFWSAPSRAPTGAPPMISVSDPKTSSPKQQQQQVSSKSKRPDRFTMPSGSSSMVAAGSPSASKHRSPRARLFGTAPASTSAGPKSLPVGLNYKHQDEDRDSNDGLGDDERDDDDDDDDVDEEDDDDEDDDDDDSSSASNSSASSGVHALSTSSSASSSSSSADSSLSMTTTTTTQSVAAVSPSKHPKKQQQQQQQQPSCSTAAVNPAEELGERIRRTVLEHNYLLSLLVNVIRQHDRLRLLAKTQPAACDMDEDEESDFGGRRMRRIDLAEIADALDDGCQCECHSRRVTCRRDDAAGQVKSGQLSPLVLASLQQSQLAGLKGGKAGGSSKASKTAITVPLRKVRRLKKSNNNNNNNNNDEQVLHLLADKLCDNCFETHFWLFECHNLSTCSHFADQHHHSKNGDDYLSLSLSLNANADLNNDHSSIKSSNSTSFGAQPTSNSMINDHPTVNEYEYDSMVALRNATFIKLVQQQVRSTISKSIELIDLIRKEIKSPESIKQKQLMKCFSDSIQLLTSVSNYVVPTQDISSFIPDTFGHEQTQLYCLPSEDFDHLLQLSSTAQPTTRKSTRSLTPSITITQPKVSQATATAASASTSNPSSSATQSTTADLSATGRSPRHTVTAASTGLQQMFGRTHQQMLMMSNSSQSMPSGYQMSTGGYRPHSTLSATINNYHLPQAPEIPIRRYCRPQQVNNHKSRLSDASDVDSSKLVSSQQQLVDAASSNADCFATEDQQHTATGDTKRAGESSTSGASSKNSSASSSIARGTVQQSSLTRVVKDTSLDEAIKSAEGGKSPGAKAASIARSSNTSQRSSKQQQNNSQQTSAKHNSLPYYHQRSPPDNHHRSFMNQPATTSTNQMSFETIANLSRQQSEAGGGFLSLQATARPKFWQSPKFNFIKKLLHVKEQRLLRQQSKDRRIYNNKVQNKFRLVMMDLTHFNKSQQLLATENGVNSLLTSMRNVLEFGLYLTLKLY